MSTKFLGDPLGDIPNFIDECYKSASAAYEREKEARFREMCYRWHREYIPERIVMVQGPKKAELYYYRTDIGTLEPLVALAPVEVSFNESPTDFSMKMKYEQRVLHPDIFKSMK